MHIQRAKGEIVPACSSQVGNKGGMGQKIERLFILKAKSFHSTSQKFRSIKPEYTSVTQKKNKFSLEKWKMSIGKL